MESGAYSKIDEVVALAEVAGDSGGIYTSHLREEGLGLLEGVGEAIEIGQRARIPVVFQSDLYAFAALAGAAVVVAGHALGWSHPALAVVGASLVFFLRFMAIRHGWRLPVAGPN